ncbi:vamp (vesicle associated membrane protein) [Anaeramoeba flamelloides]|uniref:Vamp (Vesicle associated membrane protein) n=1 Tax=Anaeramoeba flamelloides TaxID=1746091 RepID=A0AAV7Z9V9_9EUKA|nr:vamp (vesicle associated membrane protein) [Anaeramoeba flamelloides]KAJ6249081.1 vamp (vesicle associated membrane protein) [Anaeramoeba flamelloides]
MSKSQKIQKIEREIEDTKDVMTKNLDKVIDRGNMLDNLDEQSSLLDTYSSTFKKKAVSQRRKHQRRNWKLICLIFLLIVIVVAAIVVPLLYKYVL